MSLYFTYFLTCCSNDVHIFLSNAPSLLGEVGHHRKESSRVEAEEGFWICLQERLQGLVERSVVLGLMIIQRKETTLHCVPYGLEHHVVIIQITTGLLCGITVPRLIGRHISQQAWQEYGLLHVTDS